MNYEVREAALGHLLHTTGISFGHNSPSVFRGDCL